MVTRRRTPTQDPSTDLPGGFAGDPARGPRHSAACATHMRTRNTQSREELSRGGLFRVPVAMRACHGSSPAQAQKTKRTAFVGVFGSYFLCTTACGLGQRSAYESISSHVHRRPKRKPQSRRGKPTWFALDVKQDRRPVTAQKSRCAQKTWLGITSGDIRDGPKSTLQGV